MNVLVISGSTRRDSLNTRLARLVKDLCPAGTATVINDLNALPFYDGDIEASGTPPSVAALRQHVADADFVVIVTPEYNGSVPGVLGNAIDWLSRPHGHAVLDAKPVLVLSASPSGYGGMRAAQHLRTVLANAGAAVASTGMSVAGAHQRLTATGVDPEVAADLARLLSDNFDLHSEAIALSNTATTAA